jgi:hypothetical protein
MHFKSKSFQNHKINSHPRFDQKIQTTQKINQTPKFGNSKKNEKFPQKQEGTAKT